MLISLPQLTNTEENDLVGLYNEILSSQRSIGTEDGIIALEKICSGLQQDGNTPVIVNYTLSQRGEMLNKERENFTKLIYAIKTTTKITVRYDSFHGGGEKKRTIHPYTLTKINDYYYLVGYEEKSKMYKFYKLIRFVSLDLMGEEFKRDANYDTKAYIDELGVKAIGDEVRLKLHITGPYMKTLEEIPYGKNITITKYGDYIIYETTLRGEFIINEFILKMGKYCKVVKPEYLVEQIAKSYEILSNNYLKIAEEAECFPYFQVIREHLFSKKREEPYVCIANHTLEEISRWIDDNKRNSARKGIDYYYGKTFAFENEFEMNIFFDLVKGRYREFGVFDWNDLTDLLSSTPDDIGYIKLVDGADSHKDKINQCCIISVKSYEDKYSSGNKSSGESQEVVNNFICDSDEEFEFCFHYVK
jgi:predicted DNA-binding transcriptional regulator YafY